MSAIPESPLASRIRRLHGLVKAHPLSPLFARLADCYLEAGDAERALHLCLEGIKVYPDYVTAHLVLAKTYLMLRRYHDARGELKLTASIMPGSAGAIALQRRSFELEKEFPPVERSIPAQELLASAGIPAPEEVRRRRWSEKEDLIPGSILFKRPAEQERMEATGLPGREELDLEELAHRLERARIPLVQEDQTSSPAPQITAPSTEIETRPMTETLAAIYVRQERYEEAIRVYEHLIGKQPSRAADFRNAIKQIRDRLKRSGNPTDPS